VDRRWEHENNREFRMRQGLVTGHNVDRIDVSAGLRELIACGYGDSVETRFVIQYALQRWARGEEEAAKRGAIDRGFHGIDFGSWVRVLAAARAAAESVETTS
jgi:hypothetical protein